MAEQESQRREKLTPSQARAARRRRRARRRRIIRVSAFTAVALVSLLFIASLFAGSVPFVIGGIFSEKPRVGDHWHATYEVSICGEILPPFAQSPGGVHTHGGGRIHIHPNRADEEGGNANLALFFDSAGAELTDTSIRLPTRETYANGDPCPDGGTGQLVVTVNGDPVDEPSALVPRDDDEVLIAFSAGP